MTLSVGERLHAARDQKKISLEEACRVTKIQRHILEAIEEGRLEEVLSLVYARIFLKKYAAYLGLDGTAVVNEYLGGRSMVPESRVQVETELTRQPPASSFWREILVPAGTVGVAVVGVAFLVYLSLDLYGNLTRNRAVPSAGWAVSSPASAPGSERVVPLSKPLKLAVRAADKVWLQIKSDGSVIFQGVLNKGAQESWTAKRELEIWTGNAAAMQMTLNGKPLEGLGRGVKKGVKVTHAGIVG